MLPVKEFRFLLSTLCRNTLGEPREMDPTVWKALYERHSPPQTAWKGRNCLEQREHPRFDVRAHVDFKWIDWLDPSITVKLLPLLQDGELNRIGQTRCSDEIPDFTRYGWTAFVLATLPGPAEPKAFPMTGNDCLELEGHQGGSPVRSQPGHSNPPQAVRSAQTNAMAAIKAQQDEELMAQGRDFRSKSCPSSKASWQREKQGDEEGKHGSDRLRLYNFDHFKNELRGMGSQLTSFSLNSPRNSLFVLDFSHYGICFPVSLLERTVCVEQRLVPGMPALHHAERY